MSDNMNLVATEWLAARRIIAEFLRELRPDLSATDLNHNAAAILARLAGADPPLLVTAVTA